MKTRLHEKKKSTVDRMKIGASISASPRQNYLEDIRKPVIEGRLLRMTASCMHTSSLMVSPNIC